MRLPEQKLWDAFRTRAVPYKDALWLERIENMVGEGTPDVRSASQRKECWVELKAPRAPRRSTTPFLGDEGLRQSQMNWHRRAAFFGMSAYTLMRARNDHDKIALVHCSRSDELNAMAWVEIRVVALALDWEEIFEVLK